VRRAYPWIPAVAALVIAATAAVRFPTVTQGVPGAPAVVEVLGDPELAELGSRLVSDPAVWKPLPGIGTLPEVGVDSLQIWLTSDLSEGVPRGLRHPEPWVAGTANPGEARIALKTGPGLNGPRGLRSVLRHEIAHIGLGAATGGIRAVRIRRVELGRRVASAVSLSAPRGDDSGGDRPAVPPALDRGADGIPAVLHGGSRARGPGR
jgi:hypothetical protein